MREIAEILDVVDVLRVSLQLIQILCEVGNKIRAGDGVVFSLLPLRVSREICIFDYGCSSARDDGQCGLECSFYAFNLVKG